MKQLNAERIAKVMQEMAEDLRSRAALIDQQAKELIETGDLDTAVVALSAAVSTQNLNVGKLLNATIREVTRSLESPDPGPAN
jgi:Arc/MetJ family transcription regulator